jgi:hypothetical protein
MENPRGWYEAEGLMADPKNGHHTTRGISEEEVRARMRLLFPRASTILVRSEKDAEPHPSKPPAGERDYLLVGLFPSGRPGRRLLPGPDPTPSSGGSSSSGSNSPSGGSLKLLPPQKPPRYFSSLVTTRSK